MIRRMPATSAARQRGAAAWLLLLLITGVLALAAYTASGTRMTGDAAQLKRATDAAALAAAMAQVREEDADIQAVAARYVASNLGMDSAQLNNALTVVASSIESDAGEPGVRVSATFRAGSMLSGAGPQEVTVASAAVAIQKSLEVSLALPNTLNEDNSNLATLRRLGKRFARNLIDDSDRTWLALVPYSQSVNVYDANQSNRIRSWASAAALNPVELTSLFRSGYGSLADRRISDRRANLLCMYRGLNQGENYFWDEAPSGQFGIHYRADLPENDTAYGVTPFTISWVGPNPSFGEATGTNDTRYMIADRGCPSAALLPLSNDLNQIDTRLDQMSRRFNTNYAIAMGWSAMALAPSFRGSAGWGLDDDLPKEFDGGSGDRIKAIVFLVNSSGQRWFDNDTYNSYVGEVMDGCSSDGSSCTGMSEAIVAARFANLCSSFRARNLKFYLIVTGSDEATDEDGQITSASDFRRIAGPGLETCAENSSDQVYLTGSDFVASEDQIQDRLDAIADELRQQSNLVRLIE